MVDPKLVAIYDRSQYELEEFILFCVAVAGKTASTIAPKINHFLVNNPGDTPFEKIRLLEKEGKLLEALKKSKTGRYTTLVRAYPELVNSNIDLRSVTIEELEKIHGIGRKTSRFFVTYTQPGKKYAVLDTHILKYMKEYLGLKVPKATPGSAKTYARLENIFVEVANKHGVPIEVLDLEIWKYYSNKKKPEEHMNLFWQNVV